MELEAERSQELAVSPSQRTQAIRIIARSLFRDLRSQGFQPLHVIRLTTELIHLVTEHLKVPAGIDAPAPIVASESTR